MKNLPILLVIGILLHACSPKVTTRVTSSYTPLVKNEPVVVYGLNNNIPNESEKLGTVAIGDTGFSTNCDYNKVIATARSEARRVGGNALKITEHKEPNIFTSSCHRIKADILRLPHLSSKVDEPAFSDSGSGFRSPKSKEVAVVNHYYARPIDKNGYSENLGDYSKFKVAVSAGAGYRINKIADGLSSSERDHVKKIKWGVNLNLGGEYYISRSIGIGATSSWLRSSGTIIVTQDGYDYGVKDRITLFYVGPKIVFRSANQKQGIWFMDCSIGYLGYIQTLTAETSGLSDKVTGGCLGLDYGFGYDLSLSEAIGLEFRLSLVSGVLSKVTKLFMMDRNRQLNSLTIRKKD